MKNYFFISLFFFLVACNNTSQTEKDYIKNLEERNAALEKELQEVKYVSGDEAKNDSKDSKDYFTIGSSEDEVLKIMGDPESYDKIGPMKIFQYGLSSVTFENGKVESYNNLESNLKVKVRK